MQAPPPAPTNIVISDPSQMLPPPPPPPPPTNAGTSTQNTPDASSMAPPAGTTTDPSVPPPTTAGTALSPASIGVIAFVVVVVVVGIAVGVALAMQNSGAAGSAGNGNAPLNILYITNPPSKCQPPCTVNGVCTLNNNTTTTSYYCLCNPGFGGTTCDRVSVSTPQAVVFWVGSATPTTGDLTFSTPNTTGKAVTQSKCREAVANGGATFDSMRFITTPINATDSFLYEPGFTGATSLVAQLDPKYRDLPWYVNGTGEIALAGSNALKQMRLNNSPMTWNRYFSTPNVNPSMDNTWADMFGLPTTSRIWTGLTVTGANSDRTCIKWNSSSATEYGGAADTSQKILANAKFVQKCSYSGYFLCYGVLENIP